MKPEQPLVSIIIPTFNRAHLIGETLDSVLAQTYTNWECIIVDDGSSDNTDAVVGAYVEKDPRFNYHHRPDTHKPGGNGARNYGFEVSSGEYVNWFDDDDLMHPEKLLIQIRLLIKTQKVFCVCQTLVFNENIENIIGLRKKYIYSEDPLNDYIRSKITWMTPAAILLKSFLLDKNLKFNENLLKAQEYEFFIRLLYYNSNYAYTDEPLVYIRKHGNQISNNTYDPLKSYSIFRASYNSFKLAGNSIKPETKEELFRRMVGQIYLSLINKQVDMASKMKKQLMEIKVSISNQVFFRVGFFLNKFLGMEKILSFMSSKKKKNFKKFLLHKI